MLKELLWRFAAYIVSRPWLAERIVAWAKRTPYTHITSADGSEIYMERYWLFNPYPAQSDGGRRRWGNWLPSVRIHHIRTKDEDRHLHDHPWDARTLILAGGYIEQRQAGGVRAMFAGDTAPLRFGEFHRIRWVPAEGAVTLFITWRYCGTWGFWVDGKKVPYREYLGLN